MCAANSITDREDRKTRGRTFCRAVLRGGGVGIRFYADNLERELLATSLSPSAAMAFDSSAAISSMKSLAGVSLEDIFFHLN